jgi:serine/threonine protein kinase/tetratricopeptide (TPR) repeat protein
MTAKPGAPGPEATTGPAGSAGAADALVERLVEEMARRWERGERPLTEEYLARYPELRARPEAAAELIYEEVCLRQRFAAGADATDVLGRFPQWRHQLRMLLDCHHLLESGAAPPFPAAGETLGDFQLLAELGRGAQGRVFLATQPSLAGRPVVLKLVPRGSGEHLSLARLQHTHIVPLYSVHDFPALGLRGLCMPYFGGLTLASLLGAWRDRPAEGRSGRHLLEELRRAQAAAPVALQAGGPAWVFLAHASHARAVCWIGARLAEALQHAQDHGLVHLDLKPANVLLAADGQPMLLDFHLAHEPIQPGPAPRRLGGTPAYMAPEHRAALAAAAAGRPVPVAVDGRADVYALGLLLWEMLGGELPALAHRTARELRRRNVQVTAGLADILGKCLAPAAWRRYPNTGALAADLRRHLADLPLAGAPNRNWVERWQKWRRRRPYALALWGAALAALAAGGVALTHVRQQSRQAEAALEEGRDHLRQGRYEEATGVLKRGRALAAGVPFTGDLTRRLNDQARRAEQAQAARDLHLFAERVRALGEAGALAPGDARALEALCGQFWGRRGLIARRLGGQAPPERDQQVRADLLDLAVLWTGLRVRQAGWGAAARREALEVLDQAEALLGPSGALYRERQAQAAALGLAEVAREAGRQAAAHLARTAWDHLALGRACYRSGNLAGAEAHFDRALDLQPQNLWAHCYKGRCAHQSGRHADAVSAFTACVALAPERAWCFHNRGLAHEGLGQFDRALRDYDHALRLDPALAAAALNRGVLHYRAGRYPEALADLRRALDGGADPAVVCYDRSLVHLARQDRGAALDSVREALRHDPGHVEARALLERLRATR